MFFDYNRLVELKKIRCELQYQSSLMGQNAFNQSLENFIKRRQTMTKKDRLKEDKAIWRRWVGETI